MVFNYSICDFCNISNYSNDALQNCKIIGVILVIFAIFVIYTSINGVLNPYGVATNLYVKCYFTTLPTTSEISACATGYGIVLAYAIINILFRILLINSENKAQ